ncbi:hypothetical protein Cantr_01378 [Candida viswanathii]|uniref:Cell wall protein RHD3 n=1 Tax=Candida viswanathii TaxID=5486 RepID=A0A367YIC5_9ASCO|nr:hypothetical protein Cantr_01378 [Candida viswanathii]
MKFYFATILLSVGTALADTVGFQVKMLGQYNQEMVCLPVDSSSDRLYVPGNYDSYMFLDPIVDEESGLTTLATLEDTPKYVNVDSDGFLVLDDTGYGFNDTFESPNLQNIFINGLDTFYLVKNNDSYSIKVLEEQPEGSIPINLGQTGVASMIKRNRLGQELHFIRRN